MRTLPPLLALLLLAGAAVGCVQSTLEAPAVPNPVLLGPVDRVGGHRAGQERAVGLIDGEASDDASSSTSAGVATAQAKHVGSGAIMEQIVEATRGRPERDVRIDDIPAGAWARVTDGSTTLKQWVGIKARVVEVSRGH
jgi:hypothetical protein